MSDRRPRIRVVNPNSNETVTRNLDMALASLRFADGPEIVCSTLAEGPFGIETQADVESVVMPLRHMVEADNSSDAFVIDPTQAAASHSVSTGCGRLSCADSTVKIRLELRVHIRTAAAERRLSGW